ncbi:MAG TPA: hypothetical protein VHZ04_01710 [Candidatus Paceibacterota bacterium]|jgi:uncharacterized membrane protein|nr:hypothetical protein [Candidatus Paceibacterota bacterium]
MKKVAYRWAGIIAFFSNFLIVSFAWAQGAELGATSGGNGAFPTPPTGAPPTPITSLTGAGGVTGLFCSALDWIFWILIVLAVIMFLIGGYRYVTSGGEAEKVSKANRTLLYAAIAVVVGLVAAGVPSIVGSFVGGGDNVGSACSGI